MLWEARATFTDKSSTRRSPLSERYSLQLIVNNLLDEEYYHPGIRTADGQNRPWRIPQQERAAFLRLSTSF